MWTLNDEGVLQSDLLKSFPWVDHGFGTRLSRSWPGDYAQVKQIHSDVVLSADGRVGCIGEGDALITATPGQLIGIRTADCVPILLADSEKRVVAAVHAGWRGTVAQVLRRTVERMAQEYGSKATDVYAAIGPAIGKCCFEVGPEVAEQFHPDLTSSDEIPTHVDLPGSNFQQLVDAGVIAEHIDSSGLCTMCDAAGRFHSFRRDKQEAGRMVAAITIRE